MNKINYDIECEKIIKSLGEGKPTLLLHSCCAPCSSACIERLKDHFCITVYYYNPNIDTVDEYMLRSSEQVKFCDQLGVKTVVDAYSPEEFFTVAKGNETEPEGGKRCFDCYRLRLEKTAKYAEKKGFDYFATTLTVSPLKNAQVLNQIGFQLEKGLSVKYLPSDFKKKNGYLRSIELSKEYGLYRQNYCGCKFSKPEKEF